MIVKPNLQCKSPHFHGLWYFYLISPSTLFRRGGTKFGMAGPISSIVGIEDKGLLEEEACGVLDSLHWSLPVEDGVLS